VRNERTAWRSPGGWRAHSVHFAHPFTACAWVNDSKRLRGAAAAGKVTPGATRIHHGLPLTTSRGVGENSLRRATIRCDGEADAPSRQMSRLSWRKLM